MRWQASLRRKRRHLRRRFGLPRFSRRTWMFALIVFVGIVYVGVTLVADWLTKATEYDPRYYDPRDFAREQHLEGK